MTPQGPAFELRTRARWMALYSPPAVGGVFAAVALVMGALVAPSPVLTILLLGLAAFVGTCCVIMLVLVIRFLLGIPDVRLDDRGVVWGGDRSRDQSVDWDAVAAVLAISSPGKAPDERPTRAFILALGPNRSGRPARTAFGRVMAFANRLRYHSSYVIETGNADASPEQVRDAIMAHLPGVPLEVV